MSLPIPADLPAEVPRVQISNKQQTYKVEASPERFSFGWQRPIDAQQQPDVIEAALQAFAAYQKAIASRVARVALVSTRYAIVGDPAMELVSHFCQPKWLERSERYVGPLSRAENFEIHAHKLFLLGNQHVNSWMRCKTGRLQQPDGPKAVVVIEQDLNTPAEDLATADFSTAEVKQILEAMSDESDQILCLYFPDE